MMIGTLIFCAILASSIGIGAGIVACCSGMMYRRHRAEKYRVGAAAGYPCIDRR